MVFDFIKSSYKRLRDALTKTGSQLGSQLKALFGGNRIDPQHLEQLEQLFYEADLGLQTATELSQFAQKAYSRDPSLTPEQLLTHLKKELLTTLNRDPPTISFPHEKTPLVILIVGVNGNGKTTSVAKLANYFKSQNKKVMIAAADTFRAAAMEQLDIWANKIGVDIVKGHSKSDPAAVVHDALTAAKAREVDVLLIDTAGRLQTKTPLMQELEKIYRICKKLIPSAPHETLLILDATMGQNALDQAKAFQNYTPLTGLILTKLDGSAKGGVVVNICRQLHAPVKFLGVGEHLEDLEPFHPEQFVETLFE